MGLSPRDFWALTPEEWAFLIGDAEPLRRAAFDGLMRRHPDERAR